MPVACDAGKYNQHFRMFNESQCLNCTANSYSASPGQAACLPCGASSWSHEQATTCNCNGTHRIYQV